MKLKLQDIIDAIDLGCDETCSYLNLKTGKVHTFFDEYIKVAKKNKNLDDEEDWYREEVLLAKHYLEHKQDYRSIPSKSAINEYDVMEAFCESLAIEEQREEMCFLIQGRGAFSNFRRGLDRFLLLDEWYDYKNQKLREFVIKWCEGNDFEYQ